MSELPNPENIGSKVVRAAGVITAASVIGYAISFAKAAIVAAYMGTGWQMDIFLWSFAFVSMFATAATGPLTSVLVPTYLSLKARDVKLANDLFNAVMGLVLVSFLVLSVIMAAGAPLAAQWLISGMGPDGTALAVVLVWLMLPLVLFSGALIACQAVLNAERAFFWPALSNSFPALMVIGAMVVSAPKWAVYAQAIGLAAAAVAQWLVLMFMLWRQGLGKRWTLNWRVEGMGQFLKLFWPLMATQILIVCLPIVDRSMAAQFSSGSISALGYAQTLMTMTATVFLTALYTAILPFFSQQMAQSDLGAFRRTFASTIRVLLLLLMPLSVVLIVLQKPVIRMVFERGPFGAQASDLTAPAFAAYMVGVAPMAITFICSRGFNALQDSKTNALVGVFGLVAVKLALNVALVQPLGYLGLAWATSAAYTVTAVTMLWIMQRRLGGASGYLGTASKALAASAAAGLLAWWGNGIVHTRPLLQLAFGGAFGLMGYGLAAYFLKLQDVQRLVSMLMRLAWNQSRIVFQGLAR